MVPIVRDFLFLTKIQSMQLSWQIVTFQLKETFSISYGNYSSREALIVSISHQEKTGFGECTAIDYYGISLKDFIAKLTSSKTLIENQQIVHPLEFYDFLNTLHLPNFLKSALDCAYWDLFGKLEHKSCLELLNIRPVFIPESSITISIAPVEQQLRKMEASKWSKFKVKCKGFNPEAIQQLRQTKLSIALDSNGSFTEKDCDILQNDAQNEFFSYLEQPMPIGKYNVLQKTLFANWMADEDCQSLENLRSLQSHYKSINVKLVKCGGITPALALIEEARRLGFKIMIGCMTESTIGISAAAILAPLADYADLDGANLIANDIASGSIVNYGQIELSGQPGLGIKYIN